MVVCVFQEIVSFYLSCEICICKFVHSIPFYPHDVCRVCDDILCFIADIGHLYFLFSFPILCKICQILKIFPKNQLFFHWFFSLLSFCFQFYWFLFFIISFLLLAFGLFCFSRFLKWELRLLIWDFFFLFNVCI